MDQMNQKQAWSPKMSFDLHEPHFLVHHWFMKNVSFDLLCGPLMVTHFWSVFLVHKSNSTHADAASEGRSVSSLDKFISFLPYSYKNITILHLNPVNGGGGGGGAPRATQRTTQPP